MPAGTIARREATTSGQGKGDLRGVRQEVPDGERVPTVPEVRRCRRGGTPVNYIDTTGTRWEIERIDPPIPSRGFDWQACRNGDGDGDVVYGSTREECVAAVEAHVTEKIEEEAEFQAERRVGGA